MSTQKKVNTILLLCFVLCLLFILLNTAILPSISRALIERLNLQEGARQMDTSRKLHNTWNALRVVHQLLIYVYVLWQVLSALAYSRRYLSKKVLLFSLFAPWAMALFGHYYSKLGMKTAVDMHLLYYVGPLLRGLLGALLFLGFMPKQKLSTGYLKGENKA